nr:FAD-dependent monooxygenase [Kribbella qitaiheensis]
MGVQDAVNLGWKLATVLRGEASDDLLDSYATERHPVAARVLHNTRAQTALSRPRPAQRGTARGLRWTVRHRRRTPAARADDHRPRHPVRRQGRSPAGRPPSSSARTATSPGSPTTPTTPA